LLLFVVAGALFAPVLAPNDPDTRFSDHFYAPPTRPHLIDDAGEWHLPFIYRLRLVNRLERVFEEDRSERVPLRWCSDGRLVSASAPVLLLGADGFGRDVFARLAYGARVSLAVALAATLGSMLIGITVGGIAGYAGGLPDEVLSRISEFVLILPATYVLLALRAVMPLVLPERDVFLLMTGIFALVGWPEVARGVRAIVAAERTREYAQAARAMGATDWRTLTRHMLPATRGFLLVQGTLLVPGFILAEATLSFVGFGFSDRTPTWGTMLQEAANVTTLGEAPWALVPAAAIFVVVLGVNLATERRAR
jgi:peptide/nickel transport system permease protein